MDLREKIAEIISAADGRYEHADSDTITDAVMEVVEEDAVKRRAYTERRIEMARKAEAAIWKPRVRALEDENERMRDTIASRIVEEERSVQRKILKDPTNPSLAGLLVGLQRSRDIVTSRAREIAEEEA